LELRASYAKLTAKEKTSERRKKIKDWTRATSAERSVLGSTSTAEGSVL
jgi:hypothetical protein